MSNKLLLAAAAAGLVGAAVTIVKKLSKIEDRLDKVEKSEKAGKEQSTSTEPEDVEELAQVAIDLILNLMKGQDTKDLFITNNSKPKRKVVFSAAKGASKAAGRFAWNKITRKDK